MERRFQTTDIEVREHEDGTATVSGYAAVYYRANDPGSEFQLFDDVRERILPGAFDRALEESQDVRALFNHDPNMLLGRSTAGTLRLSTNKRGLQYEIDLPNTTAGRDVRESLKRGDLSGSSFAFKVRGEKWANDDSGEVREVMDVDLFDVGPVTYPAYKSTTSGVRDDFVAECRDSLQAYRDAQQAAEDAKRAELAKEHDQLDMRARIAGL